MKSRLHVTTVIHPHRGSEPRLLKPPDTEDDADGADAHRETEAREQLLTKPKAKPDSRPTIKRR